MSYTTSELVSSKESDLNNGREVKYTTTDKSKGPSKKGWRSDPEVAFLLAKCSNNQSVKYPDDASEEPIVRPVRGTYSTGSSDEYRSSTRSSTPSTIPDSSLTSLSKYKTSSSDEYDYMNKSDLGNRGRYLEETTYRDLGNRRSIDLGSQDSLSSMKSDTREYKYIPKSIYSRDPSERAMATNLSPVASDSSRHSYKRGSIESISSTASDDTISSRGRFYDTNTPLSSPRSSVYGKITSSYHLQSNESSRPKSRFLKPVVDAESSVTRKENGRWVGRGMVYGPVTLKEDRGYLLWSNPIGTMDVYFTYGETNQDFICYIDPQYIGVKVYVFNEFSRKEMIINGKENPRTSANPHHKYSPSRNMPENNFEFKSIEGRVKLRLEALTEKTANKMPSFKINYTLAL